MNKRHKAHSVPLAPEALALLGPRGAADAPLFPSLKSNAMLNALQDVRADATVHGLRSTFRNWAVRQIVSLDHGATMRDLAELALSHRLPHASPVELAYATDGLLDLRRPLMAKWAAFASGA